MIPITIAPCPLATVLLPIAIFSFCVADALPIAIVETLDDLALCPNATAETLEDVAFTPMAVAVLFEALAPDPIAIPPSSAAFASTELVFTVLTLTTLSSISTFVLSSSYCFLISSLVGLEFVLSSANATPLTNAIQSAVNFTDVFADFTLPLASSETT